MCQTRSKGICSSSMLFWSKMRKLHMHGTGIRERHRFVSLRKLHRTRGWVLPDIFVRTGPSSAVQTPCSLTRPYLNRTENTFGVHILVYKRDKRDLMLIQPNKHIWAYRTAFSSLIINISPVSKTGKELDKDTGQFCCCGGSIQNFVPIRYTHPECSKQI